MRLGVRLMLIATGCASLSLRHARSPPPTQLTAPQQPARCAPASMCGLLAIAGSKMSPEALRLQTLTLQRLVRHRGPDGSGIHVIMDPDARTCSSLAHERLAIVDPLSGNQPLFSDNRKRSLAVNGEIYNHKQLRADLAKRIPESASWFRTESDCEVRIRFFSRKRPPRPLCPLANPRVTVACAPCADYRPLVPRGWRQSRLDARRRLRLCPSR